MSHAILDTRHRTAAFTIRAVDYFYAGVRDVPEAAYDLLARLSELGVNLLAFTAVPEASGGVQFTIFPEEPATLLAQARAANLPLEGPHHALLVQGDDELGALASVHERLIDAGVDVYASSGVTNGSGAFGYVIYIREDQFPRAVEALGL